MVRVCSLSRETFDTQVSALCLHNLIKNEEEFPELNKLRQLKEETGELTAEDLKLYLTYKYRAESIVLSRADVVCTTCCGAGANLIFKNRRISFTAMLIDEAMQVLKKLSFYRVIYFNSNITYNFLSCPILSGF